VLSVVEFPTSISNINDEDISIYPNPNDGILNINSNKNERVLIYNSVGQLLKDEVVFKKLIIEDLNTGLYFVQIGQNRFRMFMN